MLELGLPHQEARKKRAQGDRQARAIGDRGGAHHRQQRQRHQHVPPADCRGKAENPPQNELPQRPDDCDGDQSPDECVQQYAAQIGAALDAYKAHKDQDRGNHDVLKQQHAQRRLPHRLRRAFLLHHHLHHDRR